MKSCRMRILCGCFLAMTALMVASLAHAQESAPVSLVTGVYSHFIGDATEMPNDLSLLRAIASPGLQQIIDKENACMEQEGLCNYDASIIVDGQDYDLKDLAIAETLSTPELVEVTASFNNFGEAHRVVYMFVSDGAGWVLEDVQIRGEYLWSLTEMLRQE